MGCHTSTDAGSSRKHGVTGGRNGHEDKDFTWNGAQVAQQSRKSAASSHKKIEGRNNGGGIQNYAGARPKLDPADFEFVNQQGKMCIKPPGSINGQAFIIDKCQDCDIYLLDSCAQVTIDECRNCRIFVGPTEASVFIRSSVNCKCAFVCRQLRTRDCHNVQIALFCRTRPIIESSTEMGFACYDWSYPQLEGQMWSVKLSPLVNFWSHVYDFTPASAAVGGPNFRLLPPSTSASKLLDGPPSPVVEALGAGSGAQAAPLLTTWGARSAPHPGYLFVLFPPRQAELAAAFAKAIPQSQATLLYSNVAAVAPDTVASLVENAGWGRGAEDGLTTGQSTGFEFSGTPEALHALQSAAQKMGGLCTCAAIGSGFRYLGIE